MFDETKKVGGQTFDPNGDCGKQVSALVDVLSKQLEELRRNEARETEQGEGMLVGG